MAPDSGVQVVDLFLETAARPFLLASYAFLHALMENREHRGAIKITNNEKRRSQSAGKQCLIAYSDPTVTVLMSIETVGSIDENQASDVTRSSSSSDK